jgi:hypothetical protein
MFAGAVSGMLKSSSSTQEKVITDNTAIANSLLKFFILLFLNKFIIAY